MQRDYLEEITAVETLLIFKGDDITFEEMYTYVLLDLLLKKVVCLKDEWLRLNPNDKRERRFTSIGKGQFFNEYHFKPHELNFKKTLAYFDKEVRIAHFCKQFKKTSCDDFDWIDQILNHSVINKLFINNSFLKFWGSLPLNSKGKKVKIQIKISLNYIHNIKEKKVLLNKIIAYNSNIFHVIGFDIYRLKEINNQCEKMDSDLAKYYLFDKYAENQNYFDDNLLNQIDKNSRYYYVQPLIFSTNEDDDYSDFDADYLD